MRLRRRVAAGAIVACVVVLVGLAAAAHELVTDDPSPPGVVVALLVGSLALASLVEGTASMLRRVVRHRRLVAALHAEAISDGAGVVVFEDPRPIAFCGGLLHPRVFVSTGARRRLAPDEVEAVLAHERHHALRHDPLRIVLGHAVADGLFFLRAARRVAERQAALL